jgi:hypothetical protein
MNVMIYQTEYIPEIISSYVNDLILTVMTCMPNTMLDPIGYPIVFRMLPPNIGPSVPLSKREIKLYDLRTLDNDAASHAPQ